MVTSQQIRASYEAITGITLRVSDKEFFSQADPLLLQVAIQKLSADSQQVIAMNGLSRAKVESGTAQSIANLGTTDIEFDVEVYDKGGISSVVATPIADPITITRTNEYIVNGMVGFDQGENIPDNSIVRIGITINGSAVVERVHRPVEPFAIFTPDIVEELVIQEGQTVGLNMFMVADGAKDTSISTVARPRLSVRELSVIV